MSGRNLRRPLWLGQGFRSLGPIGPRLLLVLVLAFLLPRFRVLPQTPPSTGEFKISTDVDLVLLDVSVKEGKGRNVSGLSQDSFHVFENGVPQKISEFAGSDVPVTIGLVMDNSGSMKPKRAKVLTAGMVFIGASNPKDQIFVVNFNDTVRSGLPEAVPFTDEIKLLRSALFQGPAEGKTALYDAIVFALGHLESGRAGRKALVVVSDGSDNCSRHTFKELLQLVEQSRATIYTIGILSPDDPDRNPQVLGRLAKVSGGESFLPQELDEITPICQRIARDIRNRYTIGYAPTRTQPAAPLRKIHLLANAPDHGRLVVQTRTSYLLPGSAANANDAEPIR